ncbi:MAG: acyl-CoA thioesterase [Legionellaceae bacterium]|nr:acyl-CoA thioesterase [Legionellaceae bacterium]
MTTPNPNTVHEKTFAIAWGDMDALGHVNNARYFDYFQQARIDWLDSVELAMNPHQGPVLLKISCTFLRPVVYPATLCLQSRLHSPGRTSVRMDHAIYQEGERMAEAESTIVWIDYQLGRPVALPQALRAFFD